MSTTIDSKVVEMQFNNKQFESGVKTSISTLDKLKQSLNLSDSAKGLDNIGNTANKINFSGLSNAVETVHAKFSALEVMAITALSNITNSAVNAGKRLLSAFTIEPIKTGFQEYETQINAVQTILANTSSKGTTLDEVNAALDELNTYADKTIYNFTEMTRNIGTFTAAGVGLKESTTAIQGIANLAAVSGSTSQQASTAMYQLSQALSAGTVKLQDWNSVVNAGMGGQVFQDALKKTAKVHGVNVDAMIKKNGSFRESIQEGWITSEILTETLSKMTKSGAAEYLSELTGVSQEQIEAAQKAVDANKDGSASYEELAKQMAATGKVSKEDALEILKMADTAEDAATKVKTFSQLMDTLKEAVQSGWTQTWEILIGDFEQAKELWTNASDYFGEAINNSAKARNDLLQAWTDLHGRDVAIESIKLAFSGLLDILKPIKEAFREVFPPTTAGKLMQITVAIRNCAASFKEFTSANADKFKSIFKGVFSILDIGRKILGSFAKAIKNLLGSEGVADLGTFILDTAAKLGDFFTSLNKEFDTDGISGTLSKIVEGISNVLSGAVDEVNNFSDVFSAVGETISKVGSKIWNVIKTILGYISENISFNGVFKTIKDLIAILIGKNLYDAASGIKNFIEDLFGKKDVVKGIKETITDLFSSLHDSINNLTSGIKIASLVGIAVAIGILTASLNTLSKLKVPDLIKSMSAIGIMMFALCQTLKSMSKTLQTYDSKGIVKSAFSMILMAAAIKILADAIEKIGSLSLPEVAKGLIGVGAGLAELCAALKFLDGVKINLRTAIAMVALAEASKLLADAMQKFGQMQWDEIVRGLSAMGGALGELAGTMAILSKVGGGKSLLGSVAILIAVQSLDEMAEGLKKFGEMHWDEISRGLAAMGGALAELGITLGALGKVAGFSSIFASAAILIVVQGLDDLAEALKKFGEMQWDEIGRGLAAMGGALLEVAGITGALGKLAGLSSLFGAGAILITIQGLDDLAKALRKFGRMSWSEIGRGLTAMGGALLEVGGMSGALGMIAGFSGLLGAGTILLVIQGLDDLANALKKFGEMTWDEIGRGLTAMGGALLEVGGMSGALGAIAGLAGLIGAGTILLVVQGLGDLADALKKFGSMDWDEIDRGLTAMMGAMSETALGGLLNTFSGFGAAAISEIAVPLGDLADSVKKWEGVSVPDGLGDQLGILAKGIRSFTFDGAGANALSTAAPGVGVMADSVKKWTGIDVPDNLGSELAILASGVKEFTFGGMGASALSTAAPGVGDMADAVKKWETVSVPADLESNLTGLATGVKAFSWAFMGGWSIGAIVEPLASLSESVTKWKNVKVPKDLKDQLTALADGVKAFNWAFMGGWSISAIVEPLGKLASAVIKWKNVKVPKDLKDQLTALADGVKAFNWAFVGGLSIATIIEPLGSLADAVKKWTNVSFPENLGTNLTDLADSINNFENVDSISVAIAVTSINSLTDTIAHISETDMSGVENFKNALNELSTIDLNNFTTTFGTAGIEATSNMSGGFNSGIPLVRGAVLSLMSGATTEAGAHASQFSTAGSTAGVGIGAGFLNGMPVAVSSVGKIMSNSLSTIVSNNGKFSSSGIGNMTSLSGGIGRGMGVVVGSTGNVITGVIRAIMSRNGQFTSSGTSSMSKLSGGITKGRYGVSSSALTVISGAITAVNGKSSAFSIAGGFMMDGLKNGILNKVQSIASAAANAAKSALNAAKKALGIASPSKEFFKIGKFTAEGLANGIEKNTKLPKDAAGALAQGIMDSFKATTKSMNFGTGAMKAYIRQYSKMSTEMEDNNKVIKKASSLITAYGESLYKETDQYKKDTEQIEEHREKLDELQKEREKILAKDTSGKNADKVKKELESIDKKIDETKQKIIDDEKAIQQHTADTFNKVRDSIKDSLSDSMDMLSTSLDSGIDLFKKFKEEATAETWNVDPFSKFGGDSDLTKQQILDNMKSQSDGLSKWKLKLDLLASKGISDELLTYLKDLGPSGSKYIEEFMKMTGAELEKADNYYKNIIAKSTKEASTEDYLANMQSQVDGIREWRADIEKLTNTNLADGLIEELKALGPEGADQIKYFLNLTAEEIEKANSLYNDKLSLSLETFLGNYADNQKAVKKWSNDMSKLVKKDFSPDIIKALGDAGMDKSKSLIEVLLNMTPEQVKKFNEDFAKSSSLSESAANSIMADYANAGKNSAKAFKEGFKTEVTDSSDEENSIVGSLTRMELGSVATDAIESGEKDVENSTTDMSEDSANAIETETVNEWELAGKCCVEGFAKGITENTFMAQARAIAMAKAALEAAEAELGVASPSKKFIRIGEYVSEGFAIGINNYANQPVDSITNLSDTILTNASNVVNGINNAMDGKINARPTISPVVDMDNVNTESLHFTSMLDAVLTEPVTSIGETVANLQAKIEESNSKVTSAINGLRDDMNGYYSGDDSEIALYVDSKKLASSLARPMNNQLNILSKRGAY